MPHQDVLHPTLALGDVECVVNGKNRAAGVAENRIDVMAPQRIHQGCRPRHSLPTVTGLLPSDGGRRRGESHRGDGSLTLKIKVKESPWLGYSNPRACSGP